MKKYDVIVIGGGAGLKIVRPAADLGFKVAVLEQQKLGGTCLNKGCIPSKMLIHAADVACQLQQAPRFYLEGIEKPKIDFAHLVIEVNEVINQESDDIIPLMNDHKNIDFYPYKGHFIDKNTLSVNNEEIRGDKIIITVGTRPQIPDIDGLAQTPFMTSEEALKLKTQPKRLIVIGGGYIATELGHYFAALGTEVSFILRSQFLRNEDQDIAEEFTRVFSKRVKVYSKTKVLKVSYQNQLFSLEGESSDKERVILEADALLLATGVVPNSDLLQLDQTDIACNEQGYIKVNERLETSQENIYAFGDIIGRHLYRHTANFEGEYLFRTLFSHPSNEAIAYPPIPYAIFTHPQIGGVGKKEKELQEEGIEYISGVNHYKNSAMGMALKSKEGFVKLLFAKKDRRLLGAFIIGDEASDMVHMLIAYMKMQGTLDDILNTIFIHPALPEIVRNAARKARTAFEKDL